MEPRDQISTGSVEVISSIKIIENNGDNNRDVNNQNEIDHFKNIKCNNQLFGNFVNNIDLKHYLDCNPKSIRYISFGGTCPFNLTIAQVRNLEIIKNNGYNNLICKFWGIIEDELLNVLKKCLIKNCVKSFSYKTSIYAEINSRIANICSIKNITANRNHMNKLRNEGISDNYKELLNNDYNDILNYYFLSKLTFKKYMLLFYSPKKSNFPDLKTFFGYNYFYIQLMAGSHLPF